MISKFDGICKTLNINALDPTAEDLAKLIHWWESTVSTDLHFDGDVQEQFVSYKALASGFLDRVQPNIQRDHMTSPIVAFNNMTPLQLAVDVGLDVYLQTLEPTPAQINNKINGITLLHLAAARGNLHTTETLLSLGANPLKKSTKGEPLLSTSLMLPINHDEKMIKNKQQIFSLLSRLDRSLLLEKNESGDSILHTMAIYGYNELINEMLNHSAELASVSNNSMRYPIHAAILNGQHECTKILSTIPGVEKLIDSKGRNALHYAAKYGDASMVSICLKSTISKNSVDSRQQTPLMLAAIAKNSSAVKELIDSGVQVNMTDDVNRSALHYAVEFGDIASLKLLLASPDININIRDNDAHHPLDLIQEGSLESDEIRDLLLVKGATSCQDLSSLSK
jgi:ankyrin repeat protein